MTDTSNDIEINETTPGPQHKEDAVFDALVAALVAARRHHGPDKVLCVIGNALVEAANQIAGEDEPYDIDIPFGRGDDDLRFGGGRS